MPAPGAKPWGLELAMAGQVGLCGFKAGQEAGDKWFTGLRELSAPLLLGEQATQGGH